ncbi:MAG: hypothetical protein LBC82_08815 [Oscillospiraceae bacterium]|jgi:hypothetical protein|nr:hypothetical protein [Oscillospiraceae bacterium]
MTKLKHTLKEDILCKMVFVKYPRLLKRFVARLLRITFESIEDFKLSKTIMRLKKNGRVLKLSGRCGKINESKDFGHNADL